MNIYGQTYRFGFGAGMTPAVKYLIITNVTVFLLQQVLPGSVVFWLGLTPRLLWSNFAIWQLFTYMFLHGGLWHILINMFVLWMFGSELERHWGSREFLKYYIVCGVGAGLFHMLLYLNSTTLVIGASGAIYGLLMAFGLLFPNRIITLLLMFVFPVQIKAKYLVMFFAAISLFSGVFGDGTNIAHFAHLGGMLVGFLYLKVDWRGKAAARRSQLWTAASPKPSSRSGGLAKITGWFRRRSERRRQMDVVRRRQHEMHLREHVDAILDKINEVGYDNLTEEEKQILKRASQLFSQQNMGSQDYGPN